MFCCLSLASQNFLFLKKNVKVLSGNSVLFGLTIVNCSPEETFGNVISKLQEERFSEKRMEKVSIKDNKHPHEVQLDTPVGLHVFRKSFVNFFFLFFVCLFVLFCFTGHLGLFF